MVNLKYKISSKISLLIVIGMILLVGNLKAQTEGVYSKGTVKDIYGNALSGATVTARNNTINSVSNYKGIYTFEGKLVSNETFTVALNGYETQEVIYSDDGDLDLIMELDASKSSREVAMLNKTRPMSSVGASAYTLTEEILDRTKATSVSTALAGRLPGYAGGYLRGVSTTNGKSPLIMVDGMVTGSTGFLNLNDIESVTVLKDAAATSIYGFQGGNGIISIRTKKGFDGEATVTVQGNYTMQQAIVKPTVLSSYQFASLYNEAWDNDGNTEESIYTAEDIEQYRLGENRDLYPDNNWYDMNISDLLQTQNIHVSGQGGSDMFKYYVSMGYLHQGSPYESDGTVPEEFGTNRFDVKSNLNIKINDYFSGYMNIVTQIDKIAAPKASDIFSSIFNIEPTVYGPTTPDNKVVVTELETNTAYSRINRAGYLKTTKVNISSITGVSLDLKKITPGLIASGEVKYLTTPISYITGGTDFERWVRDQSVTDSLAFTQFGSSTDDPISFTKSTSTSYRMEYEGKLKYKNTFGDNGVDAVALIQKQYYNSQATDGVQPFIKMTYGLDLTYSYKNLVYADFVAGYQGSEQFSPDNRYGFFPSGSAAVVLSNFDFLKDNDIISFLKLRASFGLVGNDNMASERFLYKDNLTTGSKIGETQLGNPDITWEKSQISNIGFDMSFSNNLALTFEYFTDNRTDILVSNKTIPSMIGVSSSALPLMNAGEIHSHGFEVQLGYNKKFSRDFDFGINGHFAFNDNEVISLAELNLGDDYAYPLRSTGYRVNQKWGYEIDYSNGNGYFNSEDEIVASGLTYEGASPRAGDFIYKDLNGDNIIDQKDVAPMGYSSIPRIGYGGELNMRWKRFNLSAVGYGVAQVSTFNSGCGFYESYNKGTFFTQHLNAWTPERYANGEEITAPALSLNTSSNHKANNYYLQDKSYFQLEEITVSFDIPTNDTSKIFNKKAEVYFSGRNLFTIDNMKSDDMTVTMSGVNQSPARRAYIIGFNLTF